MPVSNHYRKGKKRVRWTCPFHKDGLKKTVVGKFCPSCGNTEGLAK